MGVFMVRFTTGSLVVGLMYGLMSIAALSACGGEAPPEAPKELPPLLGLLELPVSLRSAGSAPSDASNVQVSPTELRIGGQTLMTLAGGRFATADRQGTTVGKLQTALSSPAKSTLSLEAHASVPYETLALILGSATAAGIHNVSMHVRKPGATTDAGWLELRGFDVRAKGKADDDVVIANVTPRPWSEFVNAWGDVEGGCRAAPTGSCAYKPEKIAEGGNLKIMLYAAGQGVNVNFVRVGGPSMEELKAKEKKPKVEMIDGVKGGTDPMADLANADPASDASFQFRAQEALAPNSGVSATTKPLCGTTACGVVVTAEPQTMTVRAVSLLGAAFPDGTPAPTVVFEVP